MSGTLDIGTAVIAYHDAMRDAGCLVAATSSPPTGREVYQSIVEGPGGAGRQLVRVFVDVDRNPAEVVSAYRTSRIRRYWRESAG